MLRPGPVVRRVLGAVAVLGALTGAFVAGVATGAGRPAARASSGVLDDAAAQIEAAALHPVDRDTLDAAALHGMLGAAGDPWGSWVGGPSAAAATGGDPVRTVASDSGERVVVPAFGAGVGSAVRAAVTAPAARQGLLLDLRGNPGGRLDEAVATASAFLDGGPVVSYTRRDAGRRTLTATGHGDTTTPLVVLVDGGTASAAEVVAAALQDRGRAVLVGSRTFGKGSVQEPQPLPDGTALELTVARWTTPSGRSVDGVGLVPDVEVPAGAPASLAERRGKQVLEGLRAGAGGRR
ncbi:MAG: C-terminal processing peptidase-3 [Frankiales bacterium]|nr:C-terminal processing peptidase-3 [Frankiales bacterium]